MNTHFQSVALATPGLFSALMSSDIFTSKGIVSQRGKSGVYIFFEDGNAVHVGRTRNLGGRLRGHITKSHFSASFAFKRTRRIQGKIASYVTAGSRQDLARDDEFKSEFYRQIELVKAMSVRFLEVPDPIQQYLLELYAHLELDLPLDEFDTH